MADSQPLRVTDRVGFKTPSLYHVYGTVIAVREHRGHAVQSVMVRWDWLPGCTDPPGMQIDERELVRVHSESSERRTD